MPDLSVASLARSYGIPVIDWDRPAGDSLLLSTGAGLMMATCDALNRVRWAADIGGGHPYPGLPDFLTWMNRLVPGLIIAHFWIGNSKPEALRLALQSVDPSKLVVRSNVPLGVGRVVETFHDLLRTCGEPSS